MGRTFTAQEEQPGSPGVAVLSEELWRSRFAADPNILGKTITVDGIKRNVIGVMPAGFAFPGDAALWLPLAVGVDPGNSFLRPAFGRLRPSVSQRQAQAEWKPWSRSCRAHPVNRETVWSRRFSR